MIIDDHASVTIANYFNFASTGRPVSPHVLIYAFPIAAISSVTNRVTGGALWAGKWHTASYTVLLHLCSSYICPPFKPFHPMGICINS